MVFRASAASLAPHYLLLRPGCCGAAVTGDMTVWIAMPPPDRTGGGIPRAAGFMRAPRACSSTPARPASRYLSQRGAPRCNGARARAGTWAPRGALDKRASYMDVARLCK